MKKKLLSLLCLLLLFGFAYAQPKPTAKPVARQRQHQLEKILTVIGLPYTG